MRVPPRDIRVGDRVRVVGEFTVVGIMESPVGPIYTHSDESGQDWAFTPGGNTVSIEILEQEGAG